MKFLPLIPTLLLVTTASAFAMPCDTGYLCTSASGRYKIEVQHCRYENILGNLTLEIGGKKIPGAQVSVGFDGATFGGFEIGWPQPAGQDRILSIEWLKKTIKGTIRDESRDPDMRPIPYTTTHEEAITCVDEG